MFLAAFQPRLGSFGEGPSGIFDPARTAVLQLPPGPLFQKLEVPRPVTIGVSHQAGIASKMPGDPSAPSVWRC
jgi:hypothetical protein